MTDGRSNCKEWLIIEHGSAEYLDILPNSIDNLITSASNRKNCSVLGMPFAIGISMFAPKVVKAIQEYHEDSR